jgi:hypothetical protein
MLGAMSAMAAAGAVALIGAASAHSEWERVIEITHSYKLNPWQTVNYQTIDCPESHQFLINKHLAPGRAVPKGVSVMEQDGVGVTGLISYIQSGGRRGMAMGVKDMSMTNWNPGKEAVVHVVLHCTWVDMDGYTWNNP